jgi:hypothetical protein
MRQARWPALAICLLLLAGCGAKPQELIIGKWETTDAFGKPEIYEFSKDGSASIPLFGALRADVKYKFSDNEHVEVELPDKKTLQYKVTVTKESMTATDDKGKSKIFKRVQ